MKAKPRSENPKYTTAYKLKSVEFPDGFVLLIDTREQQSPIFTRFPKGLTICSTTLKDGDYSIQGFESKFSIERKKISDFCSYCGRDRTDTVKKMERFRKFEFVGLVIEAKESELLKYQEFSQVHPETLRAALISFEVRYGLHVYYGDKESCGRWLLDRAVKFYNIKKEL